MIVDISHLTPSELCHTIIGAYRNGQLSAQQPNLCLTYLNCAVGVCIPDPTDRRALQTHVERHNNYAINDLVRDGLVKLHPDVDVDQLRTVQAAHDSWANNPENQHHENQFLRAVCSI